MPNVSDLLAQAAGGGVVPQPASADSFLSTATPESSTGISFTNQQNVADVSGSKQDSVAAAAASKMQQLGQSDYYQMAQGQATGAGNNSSGELENDLRNLDPLGIYLKYGQDAQSLIHGMAQGGRQVMTDSTAQRSTGEAFGDFGLGIGQGVINSLGSIGALGAGALNADAGRVATDMLDETNKWFNENKSERSQASARIYDAQKSLTDRDNEQQYKIDKANDGEFVASLKRIGNDSWDALSSALSDPATMTDGIAQGIGSLLTAGPLGKGIGLVAKGLSTEARTMAAIGLMEGGGAYQQANSEVANMSFADLAKNSPDYNALVKSGMSPDEARTQLANSAGLRAAAIQAPLAAATGKIAAGFEANPLATRGLRELGRNTLKEGVEETIQSATGQAAQNIGIQSTADENRDLTKGVGEQAALGGLYGLGSAGAVQAPGSVLSSGSKAALKGVQTAIQAGKDTKQFVLDRAAAVQARNEQASPVSDATVSTAAEEAHASAPEAAAQATQAVDETPDLQPEAKTEINDYVNELAGTLEFDHATESAQLPDAAARASEGATNRIDALQRMSDFANDPKNTVQDRLSVISVLEPYLAALHGFANENPEALDGLPADHPAVQFVDGVQRVINAYTQSPAYQKAQQTAENIADNAEKAGLVQPVTDENIDTPEGQQNAENHIAIADIAPQKADANAINEILKHATNGRIQLSPKQLASLKTAAALLNSAREYDAQAQAQGMKPQDVVSMQIKTDESRVEEGEQSALQHAKGIRSAYNAGNLDLARTRLNDFKLFAQHMQNKVGALNTHLVTAKPDTQSTIKYSALGKDRTFRDSKEGLYVNTRSTGSVALAKQVGLEANFVADVVNSLASAYPELGVKHIGKTPLDAALVNGTPAEIVKGFRDGTRTVGQPIQQDTQVNDLNDSPVVAEENEKTSQTDPVSEAVQEDTTVEEPVKAETKQPVTEDSQEAPVEEIPAPKNVAELHSSLVQPQAGNKFHEAFKLPKRVISRLSGEVNPVQWVKNALRSVDAMSEVTGETKNALTKHVAAAYGNYLKGVPLVSAQVENQLQTFLTEKNVGQRFLNGADANTWVQGRLLNLTEDNGNGGLQFNKQLLDTAVLASHQWLLELNNYSSFNDAAAVAKFFGINEADVTDDMIAVMNSGLTQTEAVNSLAQKISKYWGLSENKDAPLGFTKGIPMSMAAEIIQAMSSPEVGLFAIQNSRFDPEVGRFIAPDEAAIGVPKEINHIVVDVAENSKFPVSLLAPDSELRSFPDAIERVVATEPDNVLYINGEQPPMPKSQLRNPSVELTDQQKKAVKRVQAQKYYLHMPMLNLYEALGRDGIVELLGEGDLSGKQDLYNKNYLGTLEGRNLSMTSAFEQLQTIAAASRNAADAAGIDLSEVSHQYAFNMTRVNRLQMLGKQNPQSSKLMREVMLPTWSTLDMTKPENHSAFMLAVGQMLGVKVHNMMRPDAVAETQSRLDKLTGSQDVLRDFQQTGELGSNAIDILKSENKGQKLTPMQLQAISEYTRLMSQDEDGLKAFRTPMYVEADGMTNGVINAMAMMTTGAFTKDQLDNLGRGGVSIGGTEADTANLLRSQGADEVRTDMYQATTTALKGILTKWTPSLSKDLRQQSRSLLWLMNEFMNGDLTLNSQGDIDTLSRNIAKNPLTITLYGSGADGIAAKMLKGVTDNMYQRMSEAGERMSANPDLSFAEAMFPDRGETAMNEFNQHLNNLIKHNVGKDFDKLVLRTKETQPNKTWGDIKEFTLNPSELANMRSSMLNLFVQPMREAIRDTVGESVLNSADLVRRATQAQSIVLSNVFKKAVDAKVAEMKAAGHKSQEFLSQNQLDEILASLSKYAPLIKTGTQNFYVAGSANSNVTNVLFGATMNDRIRIPAAIDGPADAGVAGTPFLNIGMGDGQMVQNIYGTDNAPENSMPVFDGMNFALDRIVQDSQKANQSVYESWMNNPIKHVMESFNTMREVFTMDDYSEETRDALIGSLFKGSARDAKALAPEAIPLLMDSMAQELAEASQSIDERHAVMDSVNMAVDQMAAVGAPFVTAGKEQIDGEQVDIAHRMNDKLMEAKGTEFQYKGQPKPATVEQAKQIEAVAEKTPSGAKLMNKTALANLMKSGTKTQRLMFNYLMRVRGFDAFRVVTGSRQELMQFNRDNGKLVDEEHFMDQGNNGFYNPNDAYIYLINPTPEVVLHEMIHAASMQQVYKHYQNEDLGPLSGIVGESVESLEGLMQQFMEMDISGMTDQQQIEIGHARREIETVSGYGGNAGKAYALNEFMAWTLANKDIAEATRNEKVNLFSKLAKDAIQWIKRLVLGRKRVPENPGEDLFSNVSFHSAILIKATPNIQNMSADTVARHNSGYGNNTRLQSVIEAFDKSVTNYLGAAQGDMRKYAQRNNEVTSALQSGARMQASFAAHGFPMTQQQATAFSMIVSAMQTQAELEPNSLAALQELYTHVTKTMDYTHFLPENPQPQDDYYAQEKYNVLMGNYRTEYDAQDRSTLLPSFLALATVSDEFRSALAKLPLPKGARNTDGNVDALLDNAGSVAMEKLTAILAGQKGENAQDAVDSLTQKVMENITDSESFFEQYTSKAGGYIDQVNDFMVNSMDHLSDKVIDKAEKVKGKTNNKYVKALANSAKIMASIATEKKGALVAEGIMSALNRSRGMQPWFDIVNDMVGRTDSNASVYDMIKAVHALVQQDRQQFRQHLPTVIADKFSRELTKDEWSMLHKALGKADTASLVQHMGHEAVRNILKNPLAMRKAIRNLETEIRNADAQNFHHYKGKMEQLARYMMTGEAGTNLLRNADSIARLLGENVGTSAKDSAFVEQVDQLTSLYALNNHMGVDEKFKLANLVENEAEGVDFANSYLIGQRVEEARKISRNPAAKFNQYKGYIPSENQPGVSLIVADDSNYNRLLQMSYQRVGDYVGSSLDGTKTKQGYYFAPVSGKNVFNQGIMQNVRETANGVDVNTGFTYSNMTAGRITDPTAIKSIQKRMHRGETGEPLLPVFDENGAVVAYERSIAPEHAERLNKDTHLASMIGVWRGRQAEEIRADGVNMGLINALHKMYEKDKVNSQFVDAEYIDVFDPKELAKDKVLADAMKLMPTHMRDYARSKFGPSFMVRRDMLADTFGYREATVGDAWTGNSRWSDRTQNAAKQIALAMFGNDAYKWLVNTEKKWQNIIHDARTMIVVKSVVVPVANSIGNVYQLISRGVPLTGIVKGVPRKLAEINQYTKSRVRQVELEAELRAAQGVVAQRKLSAEIQSITDSHKRMSIWPLIQAGEFSAINDASLPGEEVELTSGRLYSYLEAQVDKLPKEVRDLGRYALITQDTALFKGLQRAVEYGDFVAKALLYDDITKRQGKASDYALSRVTEEFVNYDRLPGRFRGYAEKTGLMWFYNFKIRSAKVAMSMLRNNPVHALLGNLAPTPTLFGNIGTPVSDNLFSVLADGRLSFSLGVGQVLHAPMLNPWVNIMAH